MKKIFIYLFVFISFLSVVNASDITNTGFSKTGDSTLSLGLGVGINVSEPRYLDSVNLTSGATGNTVYLYRKTIRRMA